MGLRGRDQFWLLVNAVLLGGFLGGRLGFLATDPPVDAAQLKAVLFSLGGGFSFFGVFAGMALALLVLGRLLRVDPARLLDHWACVLPFWLATARLGCHLTGCCYGRAAGLPWSVTFTDPGAALPRLLLGVPLHPAQLYEAAGDLVLGLVLLRVVRSPEPEGTALAVFLAGYGALRFLVEGFRGDALGHAGPFSTGQLLAMGFLFLAGAVWPRRGRAAILELERARS